MTAPTSCHEWTRTGRDPGHAATYRKTTPRNRQGTKSDMWASGSVRIVTSQSCFSTIPAHRRQHGGDLGALECCANATATRHPESSDCQFQPQALLSLFR
ncbi:hypothetical protein Ddc_22012 [Ditylenchus destructor]|nr:hypothetical protein Ddc_22012 [Ditylenchus destructor]